MFVFHRFEKGEQSLYGLELDISLCFVCLLFQFCLLFYFCLLFHRLTLLAWLASFLSGPNLLSMLGLAEGYQVELVKNITGSQESQESGECQRKRQNKK